MITDVGAVALFMYFPVLYFYSKNLICWLEEQILCLCGTAVCVMYMN